jgi:hypothetical protein
MLIISLASAQEGPPPGPPEGPPSTEQHISFLTEQLDLTQDQVVKIEAILDSVNSKCEVLQEQGEGDWYESMDSMKNIMDEGDLQIEKLLSDVQLKKFERMKEECEGHRHGPEGPEESRSRF